MSEDFIARFEAFARSKPADERYDFWDIFECPVGQFGHHAGLLAEDEPIGASDTVCDLHARVVEPLIGFPRTFGALAQRLAKLRGESEGF